jgi:hypothetical protein
VRTLARSAKSWFAYSGSVQQERCYTRVIVKIGEVLSEQRLG